MLCVLFLLSNLYGLPAAADASAINILCFQLLSNADGPSNNGCARVAEFYANVTIVRDTEDFPADLSTFDVVLTNTTEAMLLDTFASVLNEFVNDGGGLIVSQPTFTPGREPFPPGFEMTVTDPLWPGFPFADPPVVEFTNAGVAHPILNGLTPEAAAGNVRTIPVNTLGSGMGTNLCSR